MGIKKKLQHLPFMEPVLFWEHYYKSVLKFRLRAENTIREKFERRCHYTPDLEKPRTYNEKLQWMKFHWRDETARICADKYAVREYVTARGFGDTLVPLVGVYNKVSEIDFGKLPDRFALKPTHGSGMVSLCSDRAKYDIAKEKAKLSRWMKQDYYYSSGEWVYHNMPRRIVCEQFLETEDGSIPADYKIYCFHGEPKCVMIASGRQTGNLCMDFFTPEWERMPFKRHNPNSEVPPEKPADLDVMLDMARKLSEPFPHVRVDLYSVKGKIYFGELTFFPATGMQPFEPFDYDLLFGSWLDLGKVKKSDGK